eukprot:Sspe_Gene.78649::Locus_49213_Transcript_1_1_Confidence_1.000_Length_1742::g.78649::m.78649
MLSPQFPDVYRVGREGLLGCPPCPPVSRAFRRLSAPLPTMTTVKSVLKRATGFGGTTRQSPPMSDRELLKAKGNKDDFAFHNHRPDPIVHPEDFPDATSNVSNSSLSKEETGDPPAAAHAPCSSPGSQVPSCSQSSCGAEEADRSQGSIPSPKSVNFSEYVEPASKAKVTISDELDIEDS